jgi:hypothetical protein
MAFLDLIIHQGVGKALRNMSIVICLVYDNLLADALGHLGGKYGGIELVNNSCFALVQFKVNVIVNLFAQQVIKGKYPEQEDEQGNGQEVKIGFCQ